MYYYTTANLSPILTISYYTRESTVDPKINIKYMEAPSIYDILYIFTNTISFPIVKGISVYDIRHAYAYKVQGVYTYPLHEKKSKK